MSTLGDPLSVGRSTRASNTANRPATTRGVGTVDLAEFLLARIAEDEATARGQIELRAARYPGEDFPSDGETFWVDRGPWLYADPARVLADCEAKREQVATLTDDWWNGDGGMLRDRLLGFMAVPYADHPGYRQEWKP